jgi:hypothetical protein
VRSVLGPRPRPADETGGLLHHRHGVVVSTTRRPRRRDSSRFRLSRLPHPWRSPSVVVPGRHDGGRHVARYGSAGRCSIDKRPGSLSPRIEVVGRRSLRISSAANKTGVFSGWVEQRARVKAQHAWEATHATPPSVASPSISSSFGGCDGIPTGQQAMIVTSPAGPDAVRATFRLQHVVDCQEICLVGEFNDWSPTATSPRSSSPPAVPTDSATSSTTNVGRTTGQRTVMHRTSSAVMTQCSTSRSDTGDDEAHSGS